MHIFKVDHLGLDNLCMNSPLDKMNPPSPQPFLPVALHSEVEYCGTSPVHVGPSIGAVIVQVLLTNHTD